MRVSVDLICKFPNVPRAREAVALINLLALLRVTPAGHVPTVLNVMFRPDGEDTNGANENVPAIPKVKVGLGNSVHTGGETTVAPPTTNRKRPLTAR